MTPKDLLFVANIILDCEEELRDSNRPLIQFIKDRCAQYKVKDVEQDIMNIVGKCTHLYQIGTVNYDFDKEIKT